MAFDRTMGSAIFRTRAWVIAAPPRASATGSLRHQEMARPLRKQPRAVVLPRLDMHAGIAPARPVDPRPRIGIARQARAQVIDREVDGLGQCAAMRPMRPPRGRAPASISSQIACQLSSMIAVISRNAAVTPPCSAGSVGLPISLSSNGQDRGQLVARAGRT